MVWGEADVVRPLDARIAQARQALEKAVTFDDAMTALSMTDQAALRAIERDYYSTPAPVTQLRQTIAQAHALKVASKQANTTRLVTPELVAYWAYQALDEWLPGYTDFDAANGGQYVVSALGYDAKAGGQVYRVSTPEGGDPRHFLVTIGVELLED